jgi:hypothetical protein
MYIIYFNISAPRRRKSFVGKDLGETGAARQAYKR